MSDKKRKGAASVPAPPTKRNKKAVASEPIVSTNPTVNEIAEAKTSTNEIAAKSRSSRKRAADFLGDDKTTASSVLAEQTGKIDEKSKKSDTSATVRKNTKKASILADNASDIENGESAETVTALTDNPAIESVVDGPEVETADGSEDEDDDQGAALLAGFDSDSEDPAEDQGDMSKTQPLPQLKTTSKKLKQAKEKGSDGPGTVYVGRIPHGFYEKQMREYFTQFGDITRLRLSRNKQTGASKHFAFIEFDSDEVAKIVAETMDNYLMFGHILKCKYAPSENLHPDVWKGANKKYRKIPHDKLQRQHLEAPKTQEQWTKKNEKEKRKRQQQAEKMKAIGYEYIVPELKDPADVIEQRKVEQAHGITPAAVTSEDQPDAIEAPPAVSADEVALKKEKESTKGKTSKKSRTQDLLTQGNLDAKNAGPEAETAKILQNAEDKKNHIETADNTKGSAVAPPKKSKKPKRASVATGSSHGEFDNLSSIAVGIEAAPAYVTDALPASLLPAESLEGIVTEEGVADAVLAGRKSDRKKVRPSKKTAQRNKDAEAAAKVPKIAPGAVRTDKKQKDKKLKSILKRGTKG